MNKLFTHKGFVLQKKSFYMLIAEGMTDFIGMARKEKKEVKVAFRQRLGSGNGWRGGLNNRSPFLPKNQQLPASECLSYQLFLFFRVTEASE